MLQRLLPYAISAFLAIGGLKLVEKYLLEAEDKGIDELVAILKQHPQFLAHKDEIIAALSEPAKRLENDLNQG